MTTRLLGKIDHRLFDGACKVTDKDMTGLRLLPSKFDGEWIYKIKTIRKFRAIYNFL
jgi:hypothetical protein